MMCVWNDDLLPKKHDKVLVGETCIDLLIQRFVTHKWYFIHSIQFLYSFITPPCVQFEFNVDIIAPTRERWFA